MKLTVRLIALLMGILMLSGCDWHRRLGKNSLLIRIWQWGNLRSKPKREYTTEGRHSQASCDYDSLIASPWNCADRTAARQRCSFMIPLFSDTAISGRTSFWWLFPVPEHSGHWQFGMGWQFSDGSALTAQEIDNSLTMAMAKVPIAMITAISVPIRRHRIHRWRLHWTQRMLCLQIFWPFRWQNFPELYRYGKICLLCKGRILTGQHHLKEKSILLGRGFQHRPD